MKPRLVSEADAAAYVGLDIPTFRRCIGAGFLPPRIPEFGLFDLRAINAALDELSFGEPRNPEASDAGAPVISEPTLPVGVEPSEPRPDDVFLMAYEVAERWGMAESTLANMRGAGEGIPYVRLPSGGIRYKLTDVLAAERRGDHGFKWSRLDKTLKDCPGLGLYLRKALLTHARKRMR